MSNFSASANDCHKFSCEMQRVNYVAHVSDEKISERRLLLATTRKGVPFYLQSQH